MYFYQNAIKWGERNQHFKTWQTMNHIFFWPQLNGPTILAIKSGTLDTPRSPKWMLELANICGAVCSFRSYNIAQLQIMVFSWIVSSIENRGWFRLQIVFDNGSPKYLTITQIAWLNAIPKLHNVIIYRQFIMIPVVLIDATNYVGKCITTQATTIQIGWVSITFCYANISFFCPALSFM